MFLGSGFNDFISKPVDIKRLDIVLNQWIRDKQDAATLREAEKQGRGEENTGEVGTEADDESRRLLEHPVEGIDFAAAMKLYGNSGAAYIQILKSFVTHTPPLLEKMDIHMETSLPDYAVEVHGLKGTCTAICAPRIAGLAKDLEFASREGKGDFVQARHGELRRQVLELTERLKVLVEGRDASPPGGEKERRREPDRELLSRLSAAAGEFNSNEVEEVLGELEQYQYENGEELILQLREQAGNFDYDALRKRLEEFLS
jgi:HPt (histidine-containing phosphotransfer) domain-containing protein